MAKADGSVIIDTRMNTSGFQNGVANMKKGFDGLGSAIGKLAKVMVGVFAVKQLVQFGKEAIELGSDLSEVQNVVDVTFENLNGEINDFAKNAIEQFGLSETAAKQYTSTMGAMLKSMGFTTREAADMGMAMTGLAADMASFYNLNAEDAFYKIRAGISGETEPLKQLGINLNVANLEQYALTQGITKSYNAMTQQEQALLRYNYLLKVTADAQGDFARTSDSWANQTRILSENFKALKATIGQGLINIFTPVIKVINVLLSKLATVANAFKAFTELITGNKSTASSGVGAAAAEYQSAADGAEAYASATQDAADATKEAEKAQKGYLSGLDEVQRYEEPDKDSAIGSGAFDNLPGGADVDYGKLAEGEASLGNANKLLDDLIEKFKELKSSFSSGFWDGLGNYKPALEDLKSDISSIKQSIKDIFTDPDVISSANNFANRFSYALGQVTGSAASIGLTIASLLVGGIEKYLNQNKNRIKKYIASMFDVAGDIAEIIGNTASAFADIFSVFGSDTSQQIAANLIGILEEVRMSVSQTSLKLGRDILNMITKPIIQNKEKIKGAIEGMLEAINPLTSGLLIALQAVSDAITTTYDKHLKPFFDSIAQGLSNIFGKILDGYNTYIVPVLQELGNKFQELMEGPFGAAIAKIEKFVGKLIDALKLLWEEVLVPFFGWIADNVSPILSPIIKLIGNKLLNAFKTVTDAIGDFFDILSGLIDFIVGVFSGNWEKAWTGIKEIFRARWNLITGIVSGAWNSIKLTVSGGVNIVKAIIQTAFNGLSTLTSTIWNAIKGTISSAWSGIKNIFSGAGDFFSGVWSSIKNAFGNVAGWFKDKFSAAWKAVKDVFSSGGKVFSGIKDGILDGLKSIINSLISGINTVVAIPFNGLNSALDGLREVSIAGIEPFSWLPSIEVPQIPYLAKGAVIPPNAPFMAVLGDQRRGNNIEAPEDLLRRIVREETGGRQSRGGTYTFVGQINRRTLFEEVIEEAKLRQTISGRNPFEMA